MQPSGPLLSSAGISVHVFVCTFGKSGKDAPPERSEVTCYPESPLKQSRPVVFVLCNERWAQDNQGEAALCAFICESVYIHVWVV